MVSVKQVFHTLFTFSGGKLILFLITFIFFIAFLCFVPIKKRRKDPTTGKYKVIKTYNVFTGRFEEETVRYPYVGFFCIIIASFIFAINYLTPQSPSYSYSPEIISGNKSMNISDIDIDRLELLSKKWVICKRSTQDTPSRFDIDDNNIDNNRLFWKTHKVVPYLDCHINTTGDWTVISVELYFPRNGASPIGEKHSHDFENIQFIYHLNNTIPSYVVFPTFEGFTKHPKVVLTWSQMPTFGDSKILVLDPDTNAFAGHEKYGTFPNPSRNIRPVLIAPRLSESMNYLSDYQIFQFYVSFTAFFVFIGYGIIFNKLKHRYYLILGLLCLSGLYHIITLQFDFIGNFSFRVFMSGQAPDVSMWDTSSEGQDYISGYGLPYNKDRWTQPSFKSVIA